MPAPMGWAIEHAWLIPALPLVSFAVVGLFIRPRSEKLAGLVATASVLSAALCAYFVAWQYLSQAHGEHGLAPMVPWSFDWLRYQPGMSVVVGVLIDPISVLLLVVVTTVSSLVHLYSIGYMQGESGYGRYFTYLNLFTFSMLGLVVAPNIVQMYICWELVGVSSFLLIGFYYTKPSAVSASKKAFIVTRFADLGFLIGVLLLGYYGYQLFPAWAAETRAVATQPFDFAYLTNERFLEMFAASDQHFLGLSLLTLAMLLVFMGAAGKSAMFPLHIWLPDAMEGPTPVSALIHAATMVVAGVYLVARLFAGFAYSGTAALFVAYVGAFTSIFAAVIAVTQDDIKRVLAFSTLSQLGYMMLALGVSTSDHALGYTASMFHLFTHAFFKALLFLGAGAIIHAVHTNDIWEMGALRRKMPVTHAYFLIATLAISGIWPLSGFFSKDEILAAALENHHPVIFAVALIVAGLTAFYMFRIYLTAFWGAPRSEHAHHVHEAPFIMLLPMGILAVLSVISGFFPMAAYVHFGEHAEHGGINFAIAIPASAMAIAGIIASIAFYGGASNRAESAARAFGVVYRTVKHKFFVDELYLFITHRIIFRLIARPVAWFDRHVVDGGVNASAWLTRQSAENLREMQTGQVQVYGLWFTGGAVCLLLILWSAFV